MIGIILNKLRSIKRKRNFHKNAIIRGVDHVFGRGGYVALQDGSKASDVIIGSHAWIHGSLISQSGGKIILGDYFKMGPGCQIQCVNKVEIGSYTRIALNVYISDNNNHPVNPLYRRYMAQTPVNDDSRRWKHSDNKSIKIGENCWIGQNVRIQKGVVIGDNSVIAANSVVTKSVPENCIAGGNPAKVLKTDIDKIDYPKSCAGFNEWLSKQ